MMHALWMLMLSGHVAVAAPSHPAYMQQPDGKTVFDANCRKCHGIKGIPSGLTKRNMPNIPTFDAKFLAKKKVEDVVEVVNKGKGDMKSLKDKLSPAEVNAVAHYVFELVNATPKEK